MLALRVIQLQRPRHGVQHALRCTREVPALEARVVVDADTSQQSDLLAAQSRDAAIAPVYGQPGALRRDPRAPRGQKVADVLAVVHGLQVRSVPRP